jgi:hypothetical protein
MNPRATLLPLVASCRYYGRVSEGKPGIPVAGARLLPVATLAVVLSQTRSRRLCCACREWHPCSSRPFDVWARRRSGQGHRSHPFVTHDYAMMPPHAAATGVLGITNAFGLLRRLPSATATTDPGADAVAQVHTALTARPGRWLLLPDNAPDATTIRSVLPPSGAPVLRLTLQVLAEDRTISAM